jgi:hypothetical protein
MLPELILYSKLEIVASHSRINFYTQIFYSTHFKTNISKHKSLHLQFNFRQNQFYVKINFSYRRTKHTLKQTAKVVEKMEYLQLEVIGS